MAPVRKLRAVAKQTLREWMVNAGDPLVVLDHVSMTYGHGQQAGKRLTI